MYDLSQQFITGGGKINPGGFVRVLSVYVDIPVSQRRDVPESDGLAIWHPGLMPFGRDGGFKAIATKDGHLSIRDAKGRFHAYIRNDEAVEVNVWGGFIARNGYVGNTVAEFRDTFEKIVSRWENFTCVAIDRANAGQHPGYVDNSAFTQVVGEFTVHQHVIMLEPIISPEHGEYEMIFDLEGNRLASKTHFPLRISKWNPAHEAACYSQSGEYVIPAA